jgi:hypothetical protein
MKVTFTLLDHIICLSLIEFPDKFVKRVPQRLPAKKNDIYVSRKTKYFFLHKRAKKLLDEGYESYLSINSF